MKTSGRLHNFLLAVAAVGVVGAAATVGLATARAADDAVFSIGAGKVTGIYFPVAGAICQMVNAARSGAEPTCVVVPGDGSQANLQALRARQLDFAIVQSDWQFWAHNGADFFADPTPFSDLNAVFALHAEPLAVAVRRDGAIAEFNDLKGKRVGMGNAASAANAMVRDFVSALGWSLGDLVVSPDLTAAQRSAALCAGELDAAVFAVGSPSATLAALASRCAVDFLPLSGPPVDLLLQEKPYYRTTEIPAGIYDGADAAVATFGVGATLVTRSDVPDAIVRSVVRAIFDDLARFRAQHPALTWLDADKMAASGLSAPLHPAAAAFYASREGS